MKSGCYVLSPGAAAWLRNAMSARAPLDFKRSSRRGAGAYSFQGRVPRAFEVHYAASSSTSSTSTPEGGWIIYLPAGCLIVDNSVVDAASALSPANGNWPENWYRLGFEPSAAVWLAITPAQGTTAASARFTTEPAGQISVRVANVSEYEVEQLVVGALAVSSSSGVGCGKSITVEKPLGIREEQRQGAGNLITIYPDGMTAVLDVVLDVEYDPETHELTYSKKRLVYNKGLLVNVLDLYSAVATTAVEETV